MDEQDRRIAARQQVINCQLMRNALLESGINIVEAPRIINALDELESGLKLGGIGIWK